VAIIAWFKRDVNYGFRIKMQTLKGCHQSKPPTLPGQNELHSIPPETDVFQSTWPRYFD
jgi:hypothetical protein